MLHIRRMPFVIEDPWTLPDRIDRIPLCRATDNARPRLQTTIGVFADDTHLNVLFQADDDGIVATYLEHDAPLYEEDVVEIFVAPVYPAHYFEIEVNPIGTTFDARIESPNGTRASMKVDTAWECADLFAAVRKMPGRTDTIVRVPFASIGVSRPAGSSEWRANFFRIDRSKSHGDEFSAWSATFKNPPDFHVTSAFGRLRFDP
jgi:cellulose/xylan binding protein with CBM9 domain